MFQDWDVDTVRAPFRPSLPPAGQCGTSQSLSFHFREVWERNPDGILQVMETRQVILPAPLPKAELRYRAGWEEGTLAWLWPPSDFRTQDSKCQEARTTNLDLTVLDMESIA